MKEPKFFSIGELAKFCGISPRQLRYYDQIGLIKPKYRNPDTGYRYYTEDQIEQLFFINELRNIGVSNESIPRLFINRDVEQLVQELQLNLAMVEQEIQSSLTRYHSIVNALVMNTRALAYLNGQEAIDSERYLQYWVSVKWIPETRILFMPCQESDGLDQEKEYISNVVELTRHAEKMNLKLADTKMSIRYNCDINQMIHGTKKNSGSYEIAREILSKEIPEKQENIKVFGGYNALCTVNIGDRSSLKDAYSVLQKWAEDHEISLSDTVIEEYMADAFTTTDRNRHVTRAIIPVIES